MRDPLSLFASEMLILPLRFSTSHDQKVVVLDFGYDLDTSLFI